MQYSYSYVLEDGLNVLVGLISGFPVTILNIATYVLTSLALYTLAQRRGIRHGWLAWIPVVNCWIIGSLSDQYRYLVKGAIKSKRKSLLVLSILNSALITAAITLAVVTLTSMAMNFRREVLGLVVAIGCVGLVLLGISVGRLVVRFMALHDVYNSMDPENGVLFLVLSILFPVTEPFFLFFHRNKDLGMPPRRDAVRQEPVWQAAQEPWDTENKDYL